MRILISILLCLFITGGLKAQINPQLLLSIHKVADSAEMNLVSALTEGSVIYNEEDESVYVWQGVKWVKSVNNAKVENEIFLEDNAFFYVSLKVGSGSYKVVRYDRSDHNLEAMSEGTGAQPIDLISVQSLIYN